MAWSTPRTWVVGEVLTAALLNTHLRDNLDFVSQPPKCRVFNSAAISIANATWSVITFNSERFDTDTMHNTVASTERITFTTAGVYLIGGSVGFAVNGTGTRGARIGVNYATVISWAEGPSAGTARDTFLAVPPTLWFAAAGDFVTCEVWQSSGVALNVVAANSYTPEFWAIWQSL